MGAPLEPVPSDGPRGVGLRARVLPRVRVGAWEYAFGSVVLVALVLRVADLANRPLHHDESSIAWFAWRFASGEGYHYDPVFHGPVQIYVMALMSALVGTGDVAVRLGPALFGTAAVALPYFLRRQIGAPAAFGASCLLCVSPCFLYFSRFGREDAIVAFWDLLLLVLLAGYLARPQRWHPAAILGVLALAFATKETTYITAFALGTFFVGALALQRRHTGRLRDAPLVAGARSVGAEAWVWGAAAFVAVFTVLFSTFFTNPQGLREGLYGSIEYWLGQQPVNRGDQPWFYYGIVLPAYEWPILLLGILGTVVAFRRGGSFGRLLVWLTIVQFAVYSWASERMPWLTLHLLVPLVVLAGLGVGAIWGARGRLAGRLGLVVVAAGLVFSAYTAAGVAYARPADPRELLVFVQSAPDVAPVRRELLALDRRMLREHGRHARIQVDSWGGTAWPWAWYLRDLPVSYVDLSVDPADTSADAVIVDDLNRPARRAELRGFRGRRFDLRVWWVPHYGQASAHDWLEWLVVRRRWTPAATLPQWLYVRGGAPSAGR